jgi:hypothetical protein
MNGFRTSCRLAHCNSPHDLIINPPTQSSWNRSVGTTINKYYINQMVKDAENKSSLKFLHLTEARYGHCILYSQLVAVAYFDPPVGLT